MQLEKAVRSNKDPMQPKINNRLKKKDRYLHKDRSIDQWNKLENPEIDAHICGQLIFSKGTKAIQWS